MKRIGFRRQRDLVPVAARNTHVDRHQPVTRAFHRQQVGAGADPYLVAVDFVQKYGADAARGIAAGIDLAPVGVADAHEGVGSRRRARPR